MLKAASHDMKVAAKQQGQEIISTLLNAGINKIHASITAQENQQILPTVFRKLGLEFSRVAPSVYEYLFPIRHAEPYAKVDRHMEEVYRLANEQENNKPQETAKDKLAKRKKSEKLPGHVYVHSKVMIVDEAFAIVGSANLNERSMWHDSEVAISFHSNNRSSAPRALQRKLFNIILKGKMPNEWTGKGLLSILKNCSIAIMKFTMVEIY